MQENKRKRFATRRNSASPHCSLHIDQDDVCRYSNGDTCRIKNFKTIQKSTSPTHLLKTFFGLEKNFVLGDDLQGDVCNYHQCQQNEKLWFFHKPLAYPLKQKEDACKGDATNISNQYLPVGKCCLHHRSIHSCCVWVHWSRLVKVTQ